MSIKQPALYIVATPIGNLEDMSPRAIAVLREVDRIAAEDTRHSAALLRHFGIDTPTQAMHEHNERQVCAQLLQRLEQGGTVAVISDAGTPLISDPGYPLVAQAHERGIPVVPIPGPSALLAALCAGGLPTDRFVFEGFLPPKSGARQRRLEVLAAETRTLVFYEAPHRLLASLKDMATLFGAERLAVLARELTKTFETVRRAPLDELCAWVESDPNQQRGEAVVLVHGAAEPEQTGLNEAQRHTAEVLARQLPVKQAAALAAEITGAKKNLFYQYLIGQSGVK